MSQYYNPSTREASTYKSMMAWLHPEQLDARYADYVHQNRVSRLHRTAHTLSRWSDELTRLGVAHQDVQRILGVDQLIWIPEKQKSEFSLVWTPEEMRDPW